MNQQRSQRIWKGALVLSISALFIKILSAVYRVPFQNIAGDVGFYIYQQVYPLYGVTFILATYGFPAMVSKFIAEDVQKGSQQKEQIIWSSFLVLSILNLLLFSMIFFGADSIALLMGDEQLASLIKTVAFSYLFIPFISILRGYFQAEQNMVPTAISQTVEQVVRVGLILLFSFFLLKRGYGVYGVGLGAILGSVLGSLFSTITLLLYSRKLWIFPRRLSWNIQKYIKPIIFYGIAVSASQLFFILIQFIDAMTIYSSLIKSGVDTVLAKGIKGIYDRGSPLIQLGTVIASSMSLTLVPLISSEKLLTNKQLMKEKVDLSIRISLFIGVGAALGLMSIMKATNIMLFQDSAGTNILQVLSVAILFSSITITGASILIALNRPYRSAGFIGISLLIKYILNISLIPIFGTAGAAFSTICAFTLAMILHISQINKDLEMNPFQKKTILSIFVAATLMVAALSIFQWGIQPLQPLLEQERLFAAIQAVCSIFIGGIVYMFVVIKQQVFTAKELAFLPFGGKVIKYILKVQSREE